ncbi:MAG: PVC-type heme-binding CxxCH protein, partial [Verrucomicrobium sp.]
MHLPQALTLTTAIVVGWVATCHGQEAKERLVRNTEALSPEQELATLKVPEGFQAQLFADDAQLGGKPINLAFDTQGRLWVTSTREYPYAVPKDRWENEGTRAKGSRDSIRVLEDLDGDGRADRVTVFANDLNIPTGVLPWKKGCIAWSIPNIVYFEDSNGDGVCDKRTILFGPLGYEKDTHGMISSLRLGLDGWVYATHGFSNTSHFKARDGSTLDLTSGNVFRFRPDGSRVERWTTGQVNPFGLGWDSWGNLYSADCHSSPIYQLMPGACYPSFGRPHEGLGFAPVMCEHAHGSTGIAGVVYLDQNVWGPEWNDRMLVGNPVTSKVNQDHITFTGSTPKANEEPDFLDSIDPWFRPVDLHLGPDSALYIADFYNRIIGHYEVPLDHPGRDRNSGRIWRIAKKSISRTLVSASLRDASLEQIVAALGDENLTRRGLALQMLTDSLEGSKKAAVQKALDAAQPVNAIHRALIARLTGEAPAPTDSPLEATHKAMATIDGRMPDFRHPDPRTAKAALLQIPFATAVPRFEELLPVRARILPGDATLKHAWMLALRSVLQRTTDWDSLPSLSLADGAEADLLQVATSIPSPASANWLIQRLQRLGNPEYFQNIGDLNYLLVHAARYAAPERESELVALAQKNQPEALDAQLGLFAATVEGRKMAGQKPGPAVQTWAAALQSRLASWMKETTYSGWERLPFPGTPSPGANPWFLQTRSSADGKKDSFACSNPPGGEKLTGILRSAPFDLPDRLTFWVAGHRG